MTVSTYPVDAWTGSAWQTESTIHQLAPYIGKTKSTMAASLIGRHTRPGDIVFDPFSGCGTVAFEAWLAGRHVIANDLSPYANLLTRAKLFPYRSIDDARRDYQKVRRRVASVEPSDLRRVPVWVREFFHPRTLKEVLAWTDLLVAERRWFLLACLMGILHHQRPGFLSFPSSHTVPYLRIKKFPPHQFPELYEYRSVEDRLEAKIDRAFRRVPALDFGISRRCFSRSADQLVLSAHVDAILTSPPYMRQLDYGRDNRLRLWFLGCRDWDALDKAVSPRESEFLDLMRKCFGLWRNGLKRNGLCVLVIGDESSRAGCVELPDKVAQIATEEHGFSLVSSHTDAIPNERRVRRGISGSTSETVLVLRNVKSASRERRIRERANAATLSH
jgi:hypothetical protein